MTHRRSPAGRADPAVAGAMEQAIAEATDESSRTGVREEVLEALRRGNEELRPAALAAQRLRVLSAAGGLWDDELEAHSFLGDIYKRTGDTLLSAVHRIRSGEADAAGRAATQRAGVFPDVTAELGQPAAAERSVAYTVLASQTDLIPDQLVNVVAGRARDDIEDAHRTSTRQSRRPRQRGTPQAVHLHALHTSTGAVHPYAGTLRKHMIYPNSYRKPATSRRAAPLRV